MAAKNNKKPDDDTPSSSPKSPIKKTSPKQQPANASTKKQSSFFNSFVICALLGALLALLFNTEEGRELVQRITNQRQISPVHSKQQQQQQLDEDYYEDYADEENDPYGVNDDSYEEEIEERETNRQDQISVQVKFRNDWGKSVSLYWENDDEEWIEVVNSFSGEIPMKTFVGHRFIFTREGTRDQIGDTAEIKPGVMLYVLPEGARRKAETDDPCSDRYRNRCKIYKSQGECERNPGWMIVNCPKSCEACHLLDPKVRCDRGRLNITVDHIWKPGDMNKMFERVLEEYGEQYSIEVVSRPPSGPWVIIFNDFVSSEEADILINWGYKTGYERSSDVGEENERGETTKVISHHRTSSNAWCMHECESDPPVAAITQRTEVMTHIPSSHYESFQLLSYDHGEYYKGHHDMSPRAKHEASGPRILTFFIYLSDVEEGGETEFPRLKLKVKPKKGRAVLWPSVRDDDPWSQDPRTFHAALPVKKGKKYGANHWIHSNNFKIPNLHGCTGSFS